MTSEAAGKFDVAFDFGWRSAFQRCGNGIVLNSALAAVVAPYWQGAEHVGCSP
jgi:hypothetical protein